MNPVIKEYFGILEKDVNTISEINIGDIVSFYDYNKKQIIQHRITDIQKINNNYIITTKGDNNIIIDNVIFLENIRGKLVLIIPYLGLILLFIFLNFIFILFYLKIISS